MGSLNYAPVHRPCPEGDDVFRGHFCSGQNEAISKKMDTTSSMTRVAQPPAGYAGGRTCF